MVWNQIRQPDYPGQVCSCPFGFCDLCGRRRPGQETDWPIFGRPVWIQPEIPTIYGSGGGVIGTCH
jgi:hypothetical protein